MRYNDALQCGENTASSLFPFTLMTKSRGQIGDCGPWNQALAM